MPEWRVSAADVVVRLENAPYSTIVEAETEEEAKQKLVEMLLRRDYAASVESFGELTAEQIAPKVRSLAEFRNEQRQRAYLRNLAELNRNEEDER